MPSKAEVVRAFDVCLAKNIFLDAKNSEEYRMIVDFINRHFSEAKGETTDAE